jgi:CHAT domain-containing protein
MATLWSVSDAYAQEFVVLFYDNLGHSNNTILAFENAQKTMRKKYPTNPRLWAAFVLVR